MNRFDNIDCMLGIAEYEDNHFDLAIVDPPYGIAMDGARYNNINLLKRDNSNWDNEAPDKEYFDELFRVSKDQIIWGGEYYNLSISPHWICWDKRTNEAADKIYGAHFELAWATKLGHKMLRIQHAAAKNADGEGILRIHPTQKPIALYKWLLTKYAKEGDLILDTHVGSASSLIACEDMGFEYVGFELDKDYYDAAQKRLTQFRSQFKLELTHP